MSPHSFNILNQVSDVYFRKKKSSRSLTKTVIKGASCEGVRLKNYIEVLWAVFFEVFSFFFIKLYTFH
jgi:hypothetical protein